MPGTVISLCDRTGNMVKPWLDAGYRAVTIDLQDSELTHPNHFHIRNSISHHITTAALEAHFPIEMIFAFPPCTHLAVSGARWFKDKGLPALIEGLSIVNACREICENSGAPWMLENPVGTLATYWREPDYTFDPCDYGDPYTKKTCLWTGGGFTMPQKVRVGDMFAEATCVEPTRGSMMHRMTGKVRGENNFARSVTPMGFARAVFKANHDPL